MCKQFHFYFTTAFFISKSQSKSKFSIWATFSLKQRIKISIFTFIDYIKLPMVFCNPAR